MFLDKESLIYNLIIELEATIDNVLLQCNCLIHLVDAENNNTAVVSKSKCRVEVGSNLHTIYYYIKEQFLKLEIKLNACVKKKLFPHHMNNFINIDRVLFFLSN